MCYTMQDLLYHKYASSQLTCMVACDQRIAGASFAHQVLHPECGSYGALKLCKAESD